MRLTIELPGPWTARPQSNGQVSKLPPRSLPPMDFHTVKIDKDELKRIKELSIKQHQEKKKQKKLVETDDFIPFILSDDEEEEKKSPPTKAELDYPKEDGKPSKKAKSQVEKKDIKPKLVIKTPLYKDMPWLDSKRRYSPNTTLRLHQEIVDFVNWMGPTEEERAARQLCIDAVLALVNQTWPGATLEIFGSVRTEFYVPSSDIDLVIMLPDELVSKNPPLKKLSVLLQSRSIAESESIQVVAKARVPIVKYIDAKTGYPVDISFNVDSGRESADLVAKYSQALPALRPLTLLLKHFLEMRGLNEVYTGGIGSYTVTCLVLSFLQTHPLVQAGLVRPHENLGVMLLDMLELYGRHFNYEQVGISVAPSVPGEFYFDKIEREWVNENRPASLCIEDPQNNENDIAKGSFSFHSVRQTFDHGFNVLVSAMHEFDTLQLEARRGAKANPNDYSILASIIRLSDQLLRHRHFVQSTIKL